MFRYGKTAQAAIMVMSFLAARSGAGGPMPGSAEIGAGRGISQALAAKLLTMLSKAGLVSGRPGPNGGYRLARPAGEIRLRDIVEVFERLDGGMQCPFGPGYCGNHEPCPLHAAIVEQNAQYRRFLEENTLAQFEGAAVPEPGGED